MGRSNGYVAVRLISIICILFLSALCSCIQEPAPDGRRPVPDIEGTDGGTVAKLYDAENWFTRKRLAEVEADADVSRTIARFATDGYQYAPEGSMFMTGAAGENRVEIALLCMGNTMQPETDVIYLAVIDTGRDRGIAPARLSFERPLDGTSSRPIADGVWLETFPPELPPDGPSEGLSGQSQRWVWEEYWSCFDSRVIAGSYGCAFSCLPALPMGYMSCYFTCVGGVTIAAIIKCTMDQLFGPDSSMMVRP